MLAGVMFLTLGCGGNRQPKAYSSQLTSDDSMTIRMGQWELIKYHSQKLGLDIDYPSFLVHQDLPEESGQEVFMADDISISVLADSLNGMRYSPGQQMMGMGAELIDVGDDYSIQEGSEDDWDYYGKVIDADSTRLITVILRYSPNHSEAVAPLREWVKNFKVNSSNQTIQQ